MGTWRCSADRLRRQTIPREQSILVCGCAREIPWCLRVSEQFLPIDCYRRRRRKEVGPLASPVRAASSPLIDLLRQQAASFTFFQAVRLLRQWRDPSNSVGEFRKPDEELVRFYIDA